MYLKVLYIMHLWTAVKYKARMFLLYSLCLFLLPSNTYSKYSKLDYIRCVGIHILILM